MLPRLPPLRNWRATLWPSRAIWPSAMRTARTMPPVIRSRSCAGTIRTVRPVRNIAAEFLTGKGTTRTTRPMPNSFLVRSVLLPVEASLARCPPCHHRLVFPFNSFWLVSFTCERPRLGCCHYRRSTMVHGSKKGAIDLCGLLMLELQRGWPSVLFVRPSKLLSRRLSFSSAGPIEADILHRLVFDDGLGVDIGDNGLVHLGDGGVVKENPVIPISALVTDPAITEAVIDAAIISDVRPPISGVPNVETTIVTPVAGCPQQPDDRWEHPVTGYP